MPQSTRGYNVWSAEEEQALRDGVRKHGLGAWEVIRRDPEFAVLEGRTGVQLKDKFRNLVKFRHISLEESKALKPKGSGPWSRKHSAMGARDRVTQRSPSVGQAGDEAAEEHAATLLTLDAGGLTAAAGMITMSNDSSKRKRRRSQENRSFGIYDQRRYRADGTLRSGDEERTDTESEGDGRSSRRQRSGQVGRGRGRGSKGRGRRRNIEDSETTTEEEDAGYDPDDQQQGSDEYVVDCPCGVRFDDGAMMVECELCKTWAHIDCLQHQATSNPALVSYDLNNYVCLNCQNKRAALSLAGMSDSFLTSLAGSNGSRMGRPTGGRNNQVFSPSGYGKSPTANTNQMLLGLANGDLTAALGLGRATGKGNTLASQNANLGLVPPLNTSIVPPTGPFADFDSLSLFLAQTRPGSAMGNRPTSPKSNGPISPSKGGKSLGTGGAPRLPALDSTATQQNLDKLLAAASAYENADNQATAAVAAIAAARNGVLGTHGALGSHAGAAQRNVGAGGAGPTAASSSHMGRPASRSVGGAAADNDDDAAQHLALSQLMNGTATAPNDVLLQLLAGNRAATPSQLFLEQMLRGATPDLGLNPFLSNTMQGVAAAAAAAASAQLQFLQSQHGVGATTQAGTEPAGGSTGGATNTGGTQGHKDELAQLGSGGSTVPNSLGNLHAMAELRPGTPDTWALLRGSTPTPDGLALQGVAPLPGLTDHQWLLHHRGSPAILNPELAALANTALQQQNIGGAGAQQAMKGSEQGHNQQVANHGPAGQISKADVRGVTSGHEGAAGSHTASPAIKSEKGDDHSHRNTGIAPAIKAEPGAVSQCGVQAGRSQEHTAAAAATALAEAAATAAANAAANSVPVGNTTGAVAAVMELVDRKSSLGVLGSAGDLAAAVAACNANAEDGYFNVEDMLRSNTPAPGATR